MHALLRFVPAHRRALVTQFIQFGMVGVVGFCADTTTVYTLSPWIGPYAAGALAYLVAASVVWLLNRTWTYRHLSHAAMHRQWAKFLLANTVGFSLNRGTYFALLATSPFCRSVLIVPVAAGAVAGMFVNFTLSRRLVFR
jgi:putative flippase GtrA